jgi:hypothetical protein
MVAALQKEVDTNAGHARKAAVSCHGQECVGYPCCVVAVMPMPLAWIALTCSSLLLCMTYRLRAACLMLSTLVTNSNTIHACVPLSPVVLQEASGAADAARQEALDLRSQLTAAQSTIKALQVRTCGSTYCSSTFPCNTRPHPRHMHVRVHSVVNQ